MINGKVKYVDISCEINCKDGSEKKNKANDFFVKTFTELESVDGEKKRKY